MIVVRPRDGEKLICRLHAVYLSDRDLTNKRNAVAYVLSADPDGSRRAATRPRRLQVARHQLQATQHDAGLTEHFTEIHLD